MVAKALDWVCANPLLTLIVTVPMAFAIGIGIALL